jgi:hypothetical protein
MYLFSLSSAIHGKPQLASTENNLFEKSAVRHITKEETKEKVVLNKTERKAAYTFCLPQPTK